MFAFFKILIYYVLFCPLLEISSSRVVSFLLLFVYTMSYLAYSSQKIFYYTLNLKIRNSYRKITYVTKVVRSQIPLTMREVINVELLERIALELSLIPEDPKVKSVRAGAMGMIIPFKMAVFIK